MSASGRSCRKIDRRGKASTDELEVELGARNVTVRLRGRVIRTLTGADAEAARAAIDDPAQLQRMLARWAGK